MVTEGVVTGNQGHVNQGRGQQGEVDVLKLTHSAYLRVSRITLAYQIKVTIQCQYYTVLTT